MLRMYDYEPDVESVECDEEDEYYTSEVMRDAY